MGKEKYSKKWFIERGELLNKQSKEYVIYLVFKYEELVYVGVTNDFDRRIYEEHFNRGYREGEPTKVLYKGIKKYGQEAFDAFIYSEHDNKNDAYSEELRTIRKFKTEGLARYNIVDSKDYVNALVDMKEKSESESDFVKGVRELSIALSKAKENIKKGTIKNIIDRSNENLYFLMNTRIKADAVSKYSKDEETVYVSEEDLLDFTLTQIETHDKDDEEYEEFETYVGIKNSGRTRNIYRENVGIYRGYDIDDYSIKIWDNSISFLMSKTVHRKFYSKWCATSEEIIEHIYNYSNLIEQYIFVLYASKNSIDDICDFLDISEYDFYDSITNILGITESSVSNAIAWGDSRYD